MGCYNSGVVAQTISVQLNESEVNRRFDQFASRFKSNPSSFNYVDKQSVISHMLVVQKILKSTPIMCDHCDGKVLQPATSIPSGMEICKECASTGMTKSRQHQYYCGCRVCKQSRYANLYSVCSKCRGGGVVPS